MGTLHNFRRFVGDSLYNFVNGIGTEKDARMASVYAFSPLDRAQLEIAYRSDWIARSVVEAPAEDATREWREWQAEQDQIEDLENAEKALNLQQKMHHALVLARLYGGSALVMGVAVGKAEEPLDIEKVGEGDLKFVEVFHQYELTPGQRIVDIQSPWFNRPEYYQLGTDTRGMDGKDSIGTGVRIHPSRVIALVGNAIPDPRMSGDNTWGDSVLQVVDDAVKAAGTVIGGIASMVTDAKMDVINIPGLTQKLSDEVMGPKLIQRFMLANKAKSSINSLLLDEKEVWNRRQTSFASMPELIEKYLTVAAGAAKIPMSRLLGGSRGKALGGSEGGGEVDVRNYYDSISNKQKNEISPALTPLDEVFIRSVLGDADESIYYEWRPLWQLSETEKAEIASKKATATKADVDMGLINPDALRKARINQLIEDGTYPGIEDAIDEFGEEPEETTEEQMAQQQLLMQKSLGAQPPKQLAPPKPKPAGE
jgi:hypothetical protein